MRQSDGADLLGANNPHNSNIGIIYVAPNDDRQSVLTAILTQDKLGRQQIAIVLPEKNKAFQRPVDFDGLKNMLHEMEAQLVFIASGGSSAAEFARQRRFPVYTSLEEYAQTLYEEFQDQDTAGSANEEDEKTEFPRVAPTPAPQEDTFTQSRKGPPKGSGGAKPGGPTSTDAESEAVPDTAQLSPRPEDEASISGNVPVAESTFTPLISANGPPDTSRRGYPPVFTPGRTPGRTRIPWLIAVLILLLLVLVGYFAYQPIVSLIFPPSATVTITPSSKELKNTYAITAVMGTPDPAKRQVQARSLYAASPDQSKTVKASGVGHIPATVALGTLTFYNSSPTDQTVPAGTVFTDSNGVQVVNDVDAVIPAGNPSAGLYGQVIVSAHAVIGGENGNILAFDFNNDPCCATGVFVRNTTAFSGGQNAQIFTYVQQADIDQAVSALDAPVMTNVQAALQKQIHTSEQLVSPAQCGTNVNSDHGAGDHASNVTVNTMVVCTGEVYDQQGVQLIAQEMLKTDPAQNPGNGYVPVGTIVTTATKATADAKGVISLLVHVEGVWVYQFGDTQKQAFAKLIAGKNQKDAQSLLLQQPGVDMTTIQFFGGDGNTLPKNQGRITIAVLSVPGLQGV
ncbi:MAG TPA: hypothetical protein VF844_11600, partial [Ktedonobacteraceae bacterium]